jgi:hypothetical protein
MFFVSADSKGVAREIFVSADSERLKVAVFSVILERLVSADSKGLRGFVSRLFSAVTRDLGTEDSKRVRGMIGQGIEFWPRKKSRRRGGSMASTTGQAIACQYGKVKCFAVNGRK